MEWSENVVMKVDYIRHAAIVNGKLRALKEVVDMAVQHPLNVDFMLKLTEMLKAAIDENEQITAYGRILCED